MTRRSDIWWIYLQSPIFFITTKKHLLVIDMQIFDDDARLIDDVRMPSDRRLGVINIRQFLIDNRHSNYRDYPSTPA